MPKAATKSNKGENLKFIHIDPAKQPGASDVN